MTVVVVAQMLNDGDHTGNWWLVLGIGWLVLILAVLAVVLVRRFNEPKAPPRRAAPLSSDPSSGGDMPEFTESERYLLLTALWNYRQTMTQLQAEHTEEEAVPVAMQRLDELDGVVDKLGGDRHLPIFGVQVPDTAS
jgi:hypothetical protein